MDQDRYVLVRVELENGRIRRILEKPETAPSPCPSVSKCRPDPARHRFQAFQEAAAREYAEYERWKEAMIQEALDEEAAGAPTYSHEEVMAEMRALLEKRIRDAAGD
jgi:predicted transcriptional regulator